MKIIPVLDIMDGRAVHAVRGKRKEYTPLKSVLCTSSDPIEVAMAFKSCGFSKLYIADLDAITKGQPHFSLFKRIADKTGLELMVDAGITRLKTAKYALKSEVSKLIIGTETLLNIEFVEKAVKTFGSERVVMSIDLMGSKIISKFKLSEPSDPIGFLGKVEAIGVSQIIVLDLEKVGSGEGVNTIFLQDVPRTFRTKLIVGGGVSSVWDLVELKDSGVYGVLMASALHSGRITTENLKSLKLL